MPYSFTCPQCGVASTKHNKAIYCSKACYTAAQVGQPTGRRVEEYAPCQYCGTPIRQLPSVTRVFCSHRCHAKSQVGKPGPRRNQLLFHCKQCGCEFHRPPSQPGLYCSMSCKIQSQYKQKVQKTCEQCGISYLVYPSAKDSRFCSRSCLKNWMHLNINKPTKIEIAMQDCLDRIGVAYVSQAEIGWWSCDFLITDTNLIIECDGDYWHSIETVKSKDIRKDKSLRAIGYDVLRITETDIRNDITECESRIRLALLSAMPTPPQPLR